jgi:hypothetical protein
MADRIARGMYKEARPIDQETWPCSQACEGARSSHILTKLLPDTVIEYHVVQPQSMHPCALRC